MDFKAIETATQEGEKRDEHFLPTSYFTLPGSSYMTTDYTIGVREKLRPSARSVAGSVKPVAIYYEEEREWCKVELASILLQKFVLRWASYGKVEAAD